MVVKINVAQGESTGPLTSLDEMDDFREEQYEFSSPSSKSSGTVKAAFEEEDEAAVTKASLDPNKKEEDFRNYDKNPRLQRVRNFYKEQHEKMTLDFVLSREKKYSNLGRLNMGVWEALETLNQYVDESDPDTNLTQMEHALQTAEAARKAYPGEKYDWLHLTALIHDMGKFLGAVYKEPQWCVVGDTFPVGMPFSKKNVFNEFFAANPDLKDEKIQGNPFGIYKEGCGLRKVHMSWGHDEYLYQVCVRNNSTLPQEALYIIRYHSFYPWHKEGQYMEICDDHDREMLTWVKTFNRFDLYSKSDQPPCLDKLAPYYKKCIAKYFPEKVLW